LAQDVGLQLVGKLGVEAGRNFEGTQSTPAHLALWVADDLRLEPLRRRCARRVSDSLPRALCSTQQRVGEGGTSGTQQSKSEASDTAFGLE